MPFDDDEQDQNQLDDDRRRKLLSLIVGSAIKPFRGAASTPGPAASPSVGPGRSDKGPARQIMPGVGGTSTIFPILARPRIPAARPEPFPPPTFPVAPAPPNILSGVSASPVRPSGPPQRKVFPANSELSGW